MKFLLLSCATAGYTFRIYFFDLIFVLLPSISTEGTLKKVETFVCSLSIIH